MKKKIECPECCYEMDKVVVREGGPFKHRIENYVCASCHHTERVPTPYEYARACRKTGLEINELELEDD